MDPVAVLDPLHPPTHQAGEHSHHHFLIDLHQVFGESVDASSDLPRHGDGVSVGSKARTHLESAGIQTSNIKAGQNKRSHFAFSSFSSSERGPVFTRS